VAQALAAPGPPRRRVTARGAVRAARAIPHSPLRSGVTADNSRAMDIFFQPPLPGPRLPPSRSRAEPPGSATGSVPFGCGASSRA
jgi:hypothetical protein